MDKCQFCGKSASVHMTQIVNNQVTVVKMCEECAAKHGLFDKESSPFAMFSNFGEAMLSSIKQTAQPNNLICSKCGCTPMSFKETGRLGCPNCYKDLKFLVDSIVETSQKGMIHKGKKLKSCSGGSVRAPAKSTRAQCSASESAETKEKDLDELQKKLIDAIEAEKYEEAARLRDEIRKLKGLKS